jgi:hypothetical protein
MIQNNTPSFPEENVYFLERENVTRKRVKWTFLHCCLFFLWKIALPKMLYAEAHFYKAKSICHGNDLVFFFFSINVLSKTLPTFKVECIVECFFCSKKFITNNSVRMKIADHNGFDILLWYLWSYFILRRMWALPLKAIEFRFWVVPLDPDPATVSAVFKFRSFRQSCLYRVFRTQADWTFILPLELPAKELRHLPRKMPSRGTTSWEVW